MEIELREIDRHFARFIRREALEAPPWLEMVVALTSAVVGGGDICLELAALSGEKFWCNETEITLPSRDDLADGLRRTQVVATRGEYRPLVLDDGRLYLYRYWRYEQELSRIIREKATAVAGEVNETLLAAGIARLFLDTGDEKVDWQQVAAAAAVRQRFCVISGGPGTGKTSTVVKIIALLLEQAQGTPLRIALAAPTGKAAARLKGSIRTMKENLVCDEELLQLIPTEVVTIHRLLGSRGGSVRFTHGADNTLAYDVVIIDEASMVALPLMAKLAVALKQEARLILLGDRDQLASVEAGAVLGDICGRGRNEPFSPEFAGYVARMTGKQFPAQQSTAPLPPLTDSLIVLKKNYRFSAAGGIGLVGRAVNEGDGIQAMTLLRNDAYHDLVWRDVPPPEELKKALAPTVIQGYRAYLTAGSPAEALVRFEEFRILCALRQGPYGVTGLNRVVEEILAEAGLIDPRNRWYKGRPIMISANDYTLKLFNGDVGLVFPDQEAGGAPRLFVQSPEGIIRKIAPVRLPAHETVYAMTIHKSQGSEFSQLLILLPGQTSELLTRELIYTGVTRARDKAMLWGDEALFKATVARRVERKSGLSAILW